MTDKTPNWVEVVSRINPERNLPLIGHVGVYLTRFILEELERFQKTPGDILCSIDSSGGYTSSALTLHKAFKESELKGSPIIGQVEGKAWSAALLAMQGCQLRLAVSTDATFLAHNPQAEPPPLPISHKTRQRNYIRRQERIFNMWKVIVKREREEIISLLLERSNFRSAREVVEFLENDRPFTCSEAIELGLLNGVIYPPAPV